MLDKISPLRQASIMFPRMGNEAVVQERIITNGNQALEKADSQKRSQQAIDQARSSDRVSISNKKY